MIEAPLEVGNIKIRRIHLDDTPSFYELSQEEPLKKWLPDQVYKDHDQTKEVLTYLISKYEESGNPMDSPQVFALELIDSQEVIGHVGLSPYKGSCEIGYAVGENYSGKGYASQAILFFSNWVLENTNLKEINGVVALENIASFKVLEKSNFELIEEGEWGYHGKIRPCRKYLKRESSSLKN